MSLIPAKAAVLATATALIFLGLFVSAAEAQVLFPARGGTGTSTAPTLGQILMGQANGSWGPQATSTLGLLTTHVAEGSNLYYTDGRVAAYLISSTTLPAFLNYWTKSGSNLHHTGGNVGIGTTSASYTLDVNGIIRSEGAAYVNSLAVGGTDSTVGGGTAVVNHNGSFPNGFVINATAAGVAPAIYLRNAVDATAAAFRFPANGLNFLDANDNNRIAISSAGNVGIGTTSPQKLLHLSGTVPTFRLESTNIGEGLETIAGAVEFFSNDASSNGTGVVAAMKSISDTSSGPGHALGFFTGNASNITERLRITSGGLVGIGTSSPSVSLDVVGAQMKLTNTANTNIVINNGGTNRLGSMTYQTAGIDRWFTGTPDSDIRGDGTEYFIGTSNSDPKLWIESNGNVGINTASPLALLTVGGNQAGNAGLEIIPGSGVVIQAYNRTSSAYASINFDGSSIGFRPNGASRLHVNANGVGIGTTSPSSLLQLFSTATTTLSVDGSSTTQGSCLELKDSDGSGYSYITVSDGVMSVSTTSCK